MRTSAWLIQTFPGPIKILDQRKLEDALMDSFTLSELEDYRVDVISFATYNYSKTTLEMTAKSCLT